MFHVLQEIESENLCQQKYEERLKEEDFGDSKYGVLRKYLWNLTEYPETSGAAQVTRTSVKLGKSGKVILCLNVENVFSVSFIFRNDC